jgi:hypothetical protein
VLSQQLSTKPLCASPEGATRRPSARGAEAAGGAQGPAGRVDPTPRFPRLQPARRARSSEVPVTAAAKQAWGEREPAALRPAESQPGRLEPGVPVSNLQPLAAGLERPDSPWLPECPGAGSEGDSALAPPGRPLAPPGSARLASRFPPTPALGRREEPEPPPPAGPGGGPAPSDSQRTRAGMAARAAP